jgi:gamma-glutamylcyclotransferase (GGCT)/AIG2-like uncharacterized protein YtfP
MTNVSLDDVSRWIAAANAARWRGGGSGEEDDAGAADAERQLEMRFHTSRCLAVYGTLAPGRPNHHVVAPLGGEWTDGSIQGDLLPLGWGATLGYPAFRPRIGGPSVAVQLLTSPRLAAAWPMLDDFEGVEYRRILVPVFTSVPGEEPRLYTVANLYAAAEAFPGEAGS